MVFLNRKPPCGTNAAKASLDIALTAAAFEQAVVLAFIDDGVYQLVKNQQTDIALSADMSSLLGQVTQFDIDVLIAEKESLKLRGLKSSQLLSNVKILGTDDIKDLLHQANQVICF